LKERFVCLLNEINRPGIPELISYLETETDFYTAPASTKHHGAEKGGLLAHSLAVYDALLKINDTFQLGFSPESMVIAALLHDLCKANYYTVSTRNAKNAETDKWEKVPYYAVSDKFPAGHGEKSVILLQRFIKLTDEEILAIRWHMNGFDSAFRGGDWGLNEAVKQFNMPVALFLSDMAATHFDKK
jgi:HD superfamily phosphohydrolase YqeK